MFGRYPIAERWRPILVAILFVALLVPLLIPRIPRKGLNAVLFFFVFPIVAFVLLTGGWFGLVHVETPRWGGLLVTLVLSFVGIAVSLPLGVVLALGRRSKMPVVKLVCVVFIETVRGIPLVTVLFMASVMLPLFLPEGVTFDKLLRALIGVAMFASAYMAEVVRGGLQAIPKGQYEGADSLGLGYWQKMVLVVLPQALKLVIPGIVNTFIGMFKDTSLVYIISMFDLLGVVRQNFSDATWASPQTPISGLVFAALVFWLFCFGMSRYSMFMERRLDTGHR
jgi:general L-amino acid transport system permease protein